MATKDDLLVIQGKNVSDRLKALYGEFQADPERLQSFIDNPTGLVLRHVLPELAPSVPTQRISNSNKLLFSVLKNPDFAAWLQEYQSNLSAELDKPENQNKTLREILPREKFLEDLSTAMIDKGDKELIKGFLRSADSSLPMASETVVTDDIAVATKAVAILLVVITAIDVTPRAPNPLHDIAASPQQLRSIAEMLTQKAIAELGK